MKDVWILGAAGRTGRAIAEGLAAKGCRLGLVGRSAASLQEMAASLKCETEIVIADSIAGMCAQLKQREPVVVMNCIGPYGQTALPVIRASAPGSHYLDLSNELPAIIAVLQLQQEAAAAGRCLVAGAGFGVLAAESLVLKLCEHQPPAMRVRADVIPFVKSDGGPLGHTLVATILEDLPKGGKRYAHGRLVRAGLGSEYLTLTLPDGSSAGTGAMPLGDLEAIRRASGAADVVAASSMAPGSALVRALMSAIGALVSIPALRDLAIRRMGAITSPPTADTGKHSWVHARVEWPNRVKEGWLRAGDGMDFTTRAAAEVAFRLAKDEGEPGAYTPGALFGHALALQAGGEFVS